MQARACLPNQWKTASPQSLCAKIKRSGYLLKCPVFNNTTTKDLKAHKETSNCGPFKRKKIIGRNCTWGSKDIRFNRQRFLNSYLKYAQITKQKQEKELKEIRKMIHGKMRLPTKWYILLKKSQTGITEIKNIVTELKDSVLQFNSWF